MTVLQWVSVVAALLAAGFWFWSATIKVPDLKVPRGMVLSSGTGNETYNIIPTVAALRRQSRLSAIAACFAAVAALAQIPLIA